MRGFWLRFFASAVGLWSAAAIVPGIALEGTGTLILAALFLGFANAVVRPIAILFTLPLTVLTLGLFLVVINAAMLGLVAALLSEFSIAGFFSACAGALVVSAVNWLASTWFGPRHERHVSYTVIREIPRS